MKRKQHAVATDIMFFDEDSRFKKGPAAEGWAIYVDVSKGSRDRSLFLVAMPHMN